jgi:hypothetical protein
MRSLAIISRHEHDIDSELWECVACLEDTKIHVYVTHHGPDYAVVWADDQVTSKGVAALRSLGFEAAPLAFTRSLKSGHCSIRLGHAYDSYCPKPTHRQQELVPTDGGARQRTASAS